MSYISAVMKQNKVVVWERNTPNYRDVREYSAPCYFYYDDPDGKYTTIYDTPVAKLEQPTLGKMKEAAKAFVASGVTVWESDINPVTRIISNHYYGTPSPKLNISFVDIEVDYDPEIGYSTIENPYAPINALVLVHSWQKKIVSLSVPPTNTEWSNWTGQQLKDAVEHTVPVMEGFSVEYILCRDEYELLDLYLTLIEDSDVLSGWNSDMFDIPYIAQRVIRVLDNQAIDLSTMPSGSPISKAEVYVNNPNSTIADNQRKFKHFHKLDFTGESPTWRMVTSKSNGQLVGHSVDFVGRITADYLRLYRKYEQAERPSYKLAYIADLVLVDENGTPTLPKLDYQGSLARLYQEDFPYFIRYNIRDAEILQGLEARLGYINLAVDISHLSGALFPDVYGTIALADKALVNYCHHTLKKVVNNVRTPTIDRSIDGALVLYPQVGQHSLVGSIDINSLYPSAIRSINISPECLIGQFEEYHRALELIKAGSTDNIVLRFDNSYHGPSDQVLEMPAVEFKQYLIDNKYAISGYGTVFTQERTGFIPAVLAEWFAKRKQFQAEMRASIKQAGEFKERIKGGDDDPEVHRQYAAAVEREAFYDRLQYVFKIRLNSLYGALTNLFFRFFDLRMGESTTGTGRMILKHQCRTVASVLDGNYDVEFPLYQTFKDAYESFYTHEEAVGITLESEVFNGKHQSDAVIYGDTDSVYFKTYADTVEEAIQTANAVADAVNRSYPEFMRTTFLCTPGYDNIIKANREIVSDSGIFVDKKRYILHIVDKEGKSVDDMKVMGLDTKKTTLPPAVAARINKFVEDYLKGEPWDSVAARVVEYKQELMETPHIMELGLPKGISSIESYEKLLKADPQTFLPGHVAAAVFYNMCREKYGDNESPRIKNGMKIKTFILRSRCGRFKSIALPTDMEVPPPWFFNDELAIDRDQLIVRLVDNPLANIVKAIGKKAPTKHTLFVSKFVEFD